MNEVRVKTHNRKGRVVRSFTRTDKRKKKQKETNQNNVALVLGGLAAIGIAAGVAYKLNLHKLKPNNKTTSLAVYKPNNYDSIFGTSKVKTKTSLKDKVFIRSTGLLSTFLGIAGKGPKIQKLSKTLEKDTLTVNLAEIDSILGTSYKKAHRDLHDTSNTRLKKALREFTPLHQPIDLLKLNELKYQSSRMQLDIEDKRKLATLFSMGNNKEMIHYQIYKSFSKLDPGERKVLFDLDYVMRNEPYLKYLIEQQSPQVANPANSTVMNFYKGYLVSKGSATASNVSKDRAKALSKIKSTQELFRRAGTEGERAASYQALDKQITSYKRKYNTDPSKDLEGSTAVDPSEARKDLIKAGFSQEHLRYVGL